MEIISLKIRTKDPVFGKVFQEVLKRNYQGFLIDCEVIGQEPGPKDEGAAAGGSTDAAGGSAGCAQAGSWGVDLCLCDDRAALREGEILLVDNPALDNVSLYGDEKSNASGQEDWRLFKYAPAKEMIGKILGLCSGRLGRRIFREETGECRIIGVFAGAGGRGSTAVSLALAQLGARLRGDRPLLLPLGQFPRGGACAATAGMPLRSFVYHTVRQEGADDAQLLQRAVVDDAFGTGRFVQPSDENPLYRLSEDGMQKVLHQAARGPYNVIIADIGTVMNPASFAVLRAADRLIMLTDGADEPLQEYLRTQLGGGIMFKTTKVINRWHDRTLSAVDRFYEEPEEKAGSDALFRIPYEPLLDHERGAAKDAVIPLEGGFTDAIEELLTQLEKPVDLEADAA